MSQLNEAEKLNKLKSLIAHHDLTYYYSDDRTVCQKGESELAMIIDLAKNFEAAEVAQVWNHWVDKKISEQFREDFYWGLNNEQ